MLYGLLAVVLMAMDQRGHYVPRLRNQVNFLLEPVYHVVEWPVRALRNVFGQFQSRHSLRHENATLREQLLSQQGAQQRLQTLTEENRRLRALIQGAAGQVFEYQFAELVRVDLDPFSHKVMVDRGSRDGVEAGQAVIDGAGVMGQVEEVHLHFSTIRLISDPNHALPVQINRTGLRTIAFGSGVTGVLKLPSVPRQADIRKGDLIVTSGLGDRFPGGYPVATVTSIDREEGNTFVSVEAVPLAALDRGKEVLLIRSAIMEVEPLVPDGQEPAAAGTQSGADSVDQEIADQDGADQDTPEPGDSGVQEGGA